MQIQVRYFASLREALGAAEWLELPLGTTVGEARVLLCLRSEPHARLLAPGRAVRAALDQAMAEDGATLHEGAELAFFPPVTGG